MKSFFQRKQDLGTSSSTKLSSAAKDPYKFWSSTLKESSRHRSSSRPPEKSDSTSARGNADKLTSSTRAPRATAEAASAPVATSSIAHNYLAGSSSKQDPGYIVSHPIPTVSYQRNGGRYEDTQSKQTHATHAPSSMEFGVVSDPSKFIRNGTSADRYGQPGSTLQVPVPLPSHTSSHKKHGAREDDRERDRHRERLSERTEKRREKESGRDESRGRDRPSERPRPGYSDRDGERDEERRRKDAEREEEKQRSRDAEKERERQREKESEKIRDRERDRQRAKEMEKEKERERRRGRDKQRERDADRQKEREKDAEIQKERDKREKEREPVEDKERERSDQHRYRSSKTTLRSKDHSRLRDTFDSRRDRESEREGHVQSRERELPYRSTREREESTNFNDRRTRDPDRRGSRDQPSNNKDDEGDSSDSAKQPQTTSSHRRHRHRTDPAATYITSTSKGHNEHKLAPLISGFVPAVPSTLNDNHDTPHGLPLYLPVRSLKMAKAEEGGISGSDNEHGKVLPERTVEHSSHRFQDATAENRSRTHPLPAQPSSNSRYATTSQLDKKPDLLGVHSRASSLPVTSASTQALNPSRSNHRDATSHLRHALSPGNAQTELPFRYKGSAWQSSSNGVYKSGEPSSNLHDTLPPPVSSIAPRHATSATSRNVIPVHARAADPQGRTNPDSSRNGRLPTFQGPSMSNVAGESRDLRFPTSRSDNSSNKNPHHAGLAVPAIDPPVNTPNDIWVPKSTGSSRQTVSQVQSPPLTSGNISNSRSGVTTSSNKVSHLIAGYESRTANPLSMSVDVDIPRPSTSMGWKSDASRYPPTSSSQFRGNSVSSGPTNASLGGTIRRPSTTMGSHSQRAPILDSKLPENAKSREYLQGHVGHGSAGAFRGPSISNFDSLDSTGRPSQTNPSPTTGAEITPLDQPSYSRSPDEIRAGADAWNRTVMSAPAAAPQIIPSDAPRSGAPANIIKPESGPEKSDIVYMNSASSQRNGRAPQSHADGGGVSSLSLESSRPRTGNGQSDGRPVFQHPMLAELLSDSFTKPPDTTHTSTPKAHSYIPGPRGSEIPVQSLSSPVPLITPDEIRVRADPSSRINYSFPKPPSPSTSIQRKPSFPKPQTTPPSPTSLLAPNATPPQRHSPTSRPHDARVSGSVLTHNGTLPYASSSLRGQSHAPALTSSKVPQSPAPLPIKLNLPLTGKSMTSNGPSRSSGVPEASSYPTPSGYYQNGLRATPSEHSSSSKSTQILATSSHALLPANFTGSLPPYSIRSQNPHVSSREKTTPQPSSPPSNGPVEGAVDPPAQGYVGLYSAINGSVARNFPPASPYVPPLPPEPSSRQSSSSNPGQVASTPSSHPSLDEGPDVRAEPSQSARGVMARSPSENSLLKTPSSLAASMLPIRPTNPRAVSSSSDPEKKKGLFGIFRSSKTFKPHQDSSPHEVWHPSVSATEIIDSNKQSDARQSKKKVVLPVESEKQTLSSRVQPPPPINVPIPISSTGERERRIPSSKVFTPFRYLTARRHRTVSAASMDATDGFTSGPNTLGSPTASMHSQNPLQPPPTRDQQAATQEWRERGHAEISRRPGPGGRVKIMRPGVVFDVSGDPAEDKQTLRPVRPRTPQSTPQPTDSSPRI